MKFATTLALVAAVSAGPISDVIASVDKDIQALTEAANSYSGDKSALVAAANKLIKDVSDGTATVKAAPDMDIGEAAPLAVTVTNMAKHGDTLESTLKGKRDQVEKAGECATVRQITSDLSSKSQALIAAVVPKVPSDLQTTAKTLSAQLTDTLKKAEEDFSEANCKDSGSGSNPTGGSGSSSAAPTGTKPTGGAGSSSAAPTASKPAGSSSAPAASGTAPVTVPTAAAGIVAPAGLFAAAVAAFAL